MPLHLCFFAHQEFRDTLAKPSKGDEGVECQGWNTLAKPSKGQPCSKETEGLLELIEQVQTAGKGKQSRSQSESGGEETDCNEG